MRDYLMPNLRRAFQRRFRQKLDLPNRFPAVLGDGYGHVNDTDAGENFVFARVAGRIATVFNSRVPAREGLKVWVGYDPLEPGLYQVLSTRSNSLGVTFGAGGTVPASYYTWGGADPLYVQLRQFMPFRPWVTNSDMILHIYRGFVLTSTGPKYVAPQTTDLTSYIPTAYDTAALVLITINTSGTLVVTDGADVSPITDIVTTTTLTNLPAIPAATAYIICGVKVFRESTGAAQTFLYEPMNVSGSTTDIRNDLADLRWMNGVFGTAGGDLAGNYPNPTLVASAVLAKLLTVDGAGSGLDADLLDGNSSAAFQLAGASAGGDLSGTYPNPTVTQARGLRETTGPTTLAMGAVADGEYLKRSGSGVVGAVGTGDVATDAIWDAKGDLAAGTGANTAAKLTAAANGKVLSTNSATATGLEWIDPASGGGVATDAIWDAKGDLAAGTGANTATKLTVGSNGQYIIADSTAGNGLLWVTGGRVFIAEATPSGTGTATFSSIAGAFQTLEIDIVGRSTLASIGVEDLKMEFNTDTTATNYRYTFTQGYNNNGIVVVGDNSNVIGRLPAATSPTNSGGVGRIVIPFYTKTTFLKNAFSHFSMRYDTGSVEQLDLTHAMEWESTSAITQIDLKLASGNFVAGTTIRLYGVY